MTRIDDDLAQARDRRLRRLCLRDRLFLFLRQGGLLPAVPRFDIDDQTIGIGQKRGPVIAEARHVENDAHHVGVELRGAHAAQQPFLNRNRLFRIRAQPGADEIDIDSGRQPLGRIVFQRMGLETNFRRKFERHSRAALRRSVTDLRENGLCLLGVPVRAARKEREEERKHGCRKIPKRHRDCLPVFFRLLHEIVQKIQRLDRRQHRDFDSFELVPQLALGRAEQRHLRRLFLPRPTREPRPPSFVQLAAFEIF